MSKPTPVPHFTWCGPLSGLLNRAATVARRQASAAKRAASLAERRAWEPELISERYDAASSCLPA